MAVDPTKITIDLSRDDFLNDFTKQTYKERYLLPGETSPQHALSRAAAAFADDVGHAQRIYDYASQGWFMFATPLLSNGGSDRGLPISCFLNVATDSRQGIFDHWEETGWLSSVGGGVGAYWGGLRSAGEKTSKGSSSTGAIPFIAVMDRIILSVSQGGTRRGSYAAYLDISHPEIEEFITMRKPTGGDQNRKATNIHNAVNISDEFMMAVEQDLPFNLRSPKTGQVVKTLQARDLWRLLIETRMQTGEPYMVFIDTINRALPEPQKKLGLKVNQSNLCVAPYTEILLDTGFTPIGGLNGMAVNAWNGLDFVPVTIARTSERSELIRVWFTDGGYLDCTPDHKFYLKDAVSPVAAAALKNGDILEDKLASTPYIFNNCITARERSAAFVSGYATFVGIEANNRLTVIAPANIEDKHLTALTRISVDVAADDDSITIRYEPKSVSSGHVPFELSQTEKREWLKGVFAAVGESVEIDDKHYTAISSIDADLIREIRLLALSVGLHPTINLSSETNVLMLDRDDLLCLNWEYKGATPRSTSIADVHPLPFEMETYCATEPIRGRLCFNGYVTGNCTEITLPTGRDNNDRMRTAVCCLSSVNAEKFDEWKDDPQFVLDLMTMLDNALTVFIDNAPPSLADAVYSASMERSVGLGLLGFQAYLQSKNVPMEGAEATTINLNLFTHLKREADSASLKLGAERGEAPDMAGTGERFAHKLAVAPNASSSILCGATSPSIEPHRANAFLHKTLSGSFPVKNRYLEKVLDDLGLNTLDTWKSIVANEGSVQHLELPNDVKAVFKTATEIDQMALVQLAADRAPLICQAQSLNLFFESDTPAPEITKAHFMAWKLGVKSLYYLRSTTPKRAENTNKKVQRAFVVEDGSEKSDASPYVIVEPVADLQFNILPEAEECLACQG